VLGVVILIVIRLVAVVAVVVMFVAVGRVPLGDGLIVLQNRDVRGQGGRARRSLPHNGFPGVSAAVSQMLSVPRPPPAEWGKRHR
jgi:hypothetical protein